MVCGRSVCAFHGGARRVPGHPDETPDGESGATEVSQWIAAAETLRSLYSQGVEALRKAYALLMALVFGGLVGLLRSYGELADVLGKVGHPQAWLEKLNKFVTSPIPWIFRRG